MRCDPCQDFKPGAEYQYILDVDPASFDSGRPRDVIADASSIFVNAVMGFTPHFSEGTAKMDLVIDQNKTAKKFYGGGDTLQEFKVRAWGFHVPAECRRATWGLNALVLGERSREDRKGRGRAKTREGGREGKREGEEGSKKEEREREGGKEEGCNHSSK